MTATKTRRPARTRKTKPGFYTDLPEAEYHAHKGSLSYSGAKVILKSPRHFRYRQDNPEHKSVFDFGTAAHAQVLGVGVESVYVAPFDDWLKRKGPEGGCQYTTDEKRIAQEDGLSPILPKDWDIVCAMAGELAGHTMAARLLSEGQPEVSAFAVDEQTGVMRRCRFDWLGTSVLTDYKTAASSDPDEFLRAAIKNRYHMQAAFYLDVAAELGHPAAAFAFIVQEKDAPYVVTVIELPEDLVERGRVLNRRALERFRDCTDSGLWPGYVPDHIVATPSAPAWAFRDEESAA